MSESFTHKSIFATIVVLSFFVSAIPSRTAQRDCGNFYTPAVRLMRVLYPELTGKSISVDSLASLPFDSDGPPASFWIKVSETRPSEPIGPMPNQSSAERVGHLSVFFQFNAGDRQLLHMFAEGSFVNTEKQRALTEQIDQHPEWTETEMADALSATGAQFTLDRKQAVLAELPLKQLETITGKVQNPTIEFAYHINSKPPHVAVMEWSIRFRAKKDGAAAEYNVSVEPFGGKVVGFGRRPLN